MIRIKVAKVPTNKSMTTIAPSVLDIFLADNHETSGLQIYAITAASIKGVNIGLNK